MRAAGTAAVVNVGAISVAALLRAAGAFGRMPEGSASETGVGSVLLLGAVNLVWVVPSFVLAFVAAAAAARRQRAYGFVLAAVLLAGAPVVVIAPLLLAEGPEVVTYLALLYGVGFARLRRLAGEVPRPAEG